MRFTTAWANVLSQNITLRVTVLLLSLTSLIFCISTMRLSLKDPLIIERACYSSVRKQVDAQHSTSEIEAFLKFALSKRFDSTASDSKIFLSGEEEGYREKEQDDLSKKGMTQRTLFNAITKVEGSVITVDADHILSVGKIRTILPFPLTVTLSSTDRTEGNPYGLIIRRVAQNQSTEGSK
jgi:hypothetical protein